jgi:hypothetical protein
MLAILTSFLAPHLTFFMNRLFYYCNLSYLMEKIIVVHAVLYNLVTVQLFGLAGNAESSRDVSCIG